VPTAGETVSGAPSGTQNSNDVGPTAAISPEHHSHTIQSHCYIVSYLCRLTPTEYYMHINISQSAVR